MAQKIVFFVRPVPDTRTPAERALDEWAPTWDQGESVQLNDLVIVTIGRIAHVWPRERWLSFLAAARLVEAVGRPDGG